MKKANVEVQKDGVKITFSGAVEKKNVVEMVERCQSGKCECMIQETKEKIKNMQVSGEDGNIELMLQGDDIDASEVKRAISNSPLIK
ncbi:hypothetical protein HUE87_06685 [Candidatus Sulfurimonas marisnigri]|uniref:HMA domain-containing protein n=1 Tax=Candidatus Sulfurimonas marisnigri TaxID=2740405 RepID=A0A7S7RNS8_9BACT|nr:hypothetical protein [Candidatus Sulfurimonas marisnigri]QOY53607.1 hypothetical protein HUE87_06685 [Candidatus Sulfurimonas marisnigri]